MIRSWGSGATRRFAEVGKSKFSGMNVDVAEKRLAALEAATSLTDLTPFEGDRIAQAGRSAEGSMGCDRQWAMAHLLSLQGWRRVGC